MDQKTGKTKSKAEVSGELKKVTEIIPNMEELAYTYYELPDYRVFTHCQNHAIPVFEKVEEAFKSLKDQLDKQVKVILKARQDTQKAKEETQRAREQETKAAEDVRKAKIAQDEIEKDKQAMRKVDQEKDEEISKLKYDITKLSEEKIRQNTQAG